MGEYFKKYTGGLALMFSVLFLLIGATKYEQIFSTFQSDTAQSFAYVKTALTQGASTPTVKQPTFNIDDDGEITETVETETGSLTYHYRALSAPNLVNNYEAFPELILETMTGTEKKMVETAIYKINRKKGLVYFLLKIEKNHQTALTNVYTGLYNITLIE